MLPERMVEEIIQLLRSRYPDWESCTHPPFVADEIRYKQETIRLAASLLAKEELDALLAAGELDEIMARLHRISTDNNLLWRAIPAKSETAVLSAEKLDKTGFCTQIRNLLYADQPLPQRLQHFVDYLQAHDLPCKWPFVTYFPFICHPQEALFVRPRPIKWFLKFMGVADLYDSRPDGASYAQMLSLAQQWRASLPGAQDMVAVQSAIWVCQKAAKAQTGRLDTEGQVALDVPTTPPLQPLAYGEPVAGAETAVAESQPSYETNPPPEKNLPYTLAEMAADTGYDLETLTAWKQAVARKKQIIFYGPPGTGKTFVARHLARHLVGGGDGLQTLLQFHPATSYEEFVQGLRPVRQKGGVLHFELKNGRFLEFCAQIKDRSGPSVLIIDEINRANLAAVLGELMYLLEYRQESVTLAAGGRFQIPDSLHIIGTMNTADRSTALVDHALRRRFAFLHLPPNYQILRTYHAQTGYDPSALITLLQQINRVIGDVNYQLGVSFFLHDDLPQQLASIWQTEIEPYLEEIFFAQPDQIAQFRWPQVQDQLLAIG